ncbi:hypothetical protein [Caulobacter sp. Root1472]|uniref:hypothetical protein n=1 Tax=Caulobacter sp. Root1472 TaxID=1736470 RepID=UPI0006FD7CF9|nr:hypothetical protein [Caulobacter sp. Root1472]KQZ33808.1 hypothetical protein ASD47_01675 [Caulobacter sp. Root1472]
MILTPEALYLQLGRLVADMPDFVGPGPVTDATNAWLGRAAALVDQNADLADKMSFKVAAQNLTGTLHVGNVQTIKSVVHAALARAELAAPLSVQGAFIQAGGTFDAFVAFGKAVESATVDVMIVDPYADAKALTDFAVQAPEGVAMRILADAEYRKATLKPATESWQAQHGASRPLEVRLTPKKALHDRLIFVDNKLVWTLGQSLNAIAARAPTSIVRVDPETAALKVAAYEDLWATATPI